MKNSKIEWTDHTFNPWSGCTKVSPGCANCYAAALAKRAPKTLGAWGSGAPRRRTSAVYWKQPLVWDRAAAWQERDAEACGRALPPRPRVFCASLADWLDDEVPIEWLVDLIELIRRTPHLDWLALSKRPQNWPHRIARATNAVADSDPTLAAWSRAWLNGTPPANVWIGTTVEDQTRADERIPHLLHIPARVRFLSCEPLLGPVNLLYSCFNGADSFGTMPGIHWVIYGGESGPKARPMHPAWARSLRDQCAAAGVPFFFKQWGEWLPQYQQMEREREVNILRAHHWPDGASAHRISKSAAGRLLDGREHNEIPEVRHA